MPLTLLEKSALFLAGFTALGIGVVILVAPQAFYAGYGIPLGDDPSLLSELRAPAAGLATFGALMLAGVWHIALVPLSLAVALTVFLAFPAGRLVGLWFDGVPSDPVIAALFFELAVAAFCLVAFARRLGWARSTIGS